MQHNNIDDMNYAVHFSITDPVMAELARKFSNLKPPESLKIVENRFEYLTHTILYQQLSTKAADAISKRFRALYKTKVFPKPEQIMKTSPETLRGVGISWAKAGYILDLAEKVNHKEVILDNLHELADKEVIVELTKVKGIGRWTAEMFLMSALDRPDVFSLGDLGLRAAIQRLYGFKKIPSKSTIMRISQKWSPYRTVASRLLWASLDNIDLAP